MTERLEALDLLRVTLNDPTAKFRDGQWEAIDRLVNCHERLLMVQRTGWGKSNNLVLVSPFNPEAGFNVGNMMARNRYIYCLADAAVVVSSTPNKGGTWRGAIEGLKAGWVPLWVKKSCAGNSGNTELVRYGAKEWSSSDFSNLITLFDNVQSVNQPISSEDLDFNQLFLHHLTRWTSKEALTPDEIGERLNVNKNQVSVWLKWGVGEERIRKLHNPVRYQYERQQSLALGSS